MNRLSWIFPNLWTAGQDGTTKRLTRGRRFGGDIFVVPRKNCEYNVVPVARDDHVGLEAIRQKIKFQNNFLDSDVLVYPLKGQYTKKYVAVWIMDISAHSESVVGNFPRYIPEPLARVPKGNKGYRFVRGVRGYDGELWNSSGELIASRWWEKKPTESQWEMFSVEAFREHFSIVDGDIEIERAQPEVKDVGWRDALLRTNRSVYQSLRQVRPLQLLLIMILFFLMPASYYTSKFLLLSLEASKVSTDLLAQRELAKNWLGLRDNFIRKSKRAFQYSTIDQGYHVLSGLEVLSNSLQGGDETSIERIEYSEGEMKVTLSNVSNENMGNVIGQMEESEIWSDVRYQSSIRTISGNIRDVLSQDD